MAQHSRALTSRCFTDDAIAKGNIVAKSIKLVVVCTYSHFRTLVKLISTKIIALRQSITRPANTHIKQAGDSHLPLMNIAGCGRHLMFS
jgi:hypothetical protein